ncbi:UNVERIFIED_CONTAM: hypothetical protein FKN15_034494 [Acipenser sinensis]
MLNPFYTSSVAHFHDLSVCYVKRAKYLGAVALSQHQTRTTLHYCYETAFEAGVRVQIHSQFEPPFVHELGFGVAPGFQTFVSTQEQRLPWLPARGQVGPERRQPSQTPVLAPQPPPPTLHQPPPPETSRSPSIASLHS